MTAVLSPAAAGVLLAGSLACAAVGAAELAAVMAERRTTRGRHRR